MHGVNFGGKHTFWDWGLLLQEAPVVSPPTPKTKLVDILGADGSLDLSEILTGKVQYEMREIKCNLTMRGHRDGWSFLYSEILNHLHGKSMEITLDNDPEHYYTGRAEVSEWEPKQTVAHLTIKATVMPHKVSRLDGKKVL